MTALVPMPTDIEQAAGQVFEAMMWALSRPGQVMDCQLSMGDLAICLLDLEVGHATASRALAAEIAFTGSPSAAIESADFLFYPHVEAQDLVALREINCGDHLYPDESATLVVGAAFGRGQELKLTGPGIAGEVRIRIDGLPSGFWDMRRRTITYPLGWDLFLLSETGLMGLPRSTHIEVL